MKEMGDSYQNIYITSDEEIKEGDWVYSETRNKVCKVTGVSKWSHKDDYSIDLDNENYYIHNSYGKKIILTTDQDLIKDGVQAIDDEFLEWFVKNPSCEEVVVDKPISRGIPLLGYKIIIPQEEPKQETFEESVNAFKKTDVYINYIKQKQGRMYSEEEVKEIIKLSCEEGMFIQRTINDKVNIPYTRIKDFTIKMFEQFKKK
jgi:predicted XRE-type DNA-binding protein